MTDTFVWKVHATAAGGDKFTVAKAQFGDGFSQVVPLGINPVRQEWDVTVSAYKTDIKTIRDFLRDHIGQSFFWTPPLEDEPGYYRCDDGSQPSDQGGGYWTLSMRFYEAPQP